MKKLFTLLLLTSILSINVNAQGTVLSPGNIAIVQYQADTPDAFAFVSLVPLVAGTTIYFTDCGTSSGGTFVAPCNEGGIVFVAGAAVDAGELFFWDVTTGGGAQFTAYSGPGTNSNLALSTSGDQIIAFQDTDGAGGMDAFANPTFIFAVNGASTAWTGDPSDSNQTSLPAGLTDGSTAVAVGSGAGVQDEVDNSVFNPVDMPYSDAATALAAIADASNWVAAADDTDNPYAMHVATLMALANALPVELISFRVMAMTDEVKLLWATASEENNEGFIVEHSVDGRNFSVVGMIDGNGTTERVQEYSFMHDTPNRGLNYYRLKQIDFDGAFEYSDVRVVEFNSGTNKDKIVVAPNPASGYLNVTVPDVSTSSTVLNFQVYNQLGQLVSSELMAVDAVSVELDINDLGVGVYVLRVQSKNILYSTPFIKQ